MNLEDALEMAWRQLDAFRLTSSGWTVNLDETKVFLGWCYYEHKLITLSMFHVEQHGEAEVLDTILHEIAHALVGPGHDHDERWQAYARIVGAKPQACQGYAPLTRKTTPPVIYL